MRHPRALVLLSFTLAGAFAACRSNANPQSGTPDTTAMRDASAADTQGGAWTTLFDGHGTDAWRGYKQETMPAGWTVVGDTLTKTGESNDIVTKGEYGDFELTLDWKLSPGGNAGIFYRGNENNERIYWSGPEYQLLDDARHPDGRSRLTAAGAAYGLYPSPAGVVKPAGEWNSTRIIAKGAHVEHWLNGTKLLEYELWSPDWEAKVRASKFGEWKDYGRAARGHIGIQGDHDGTLSLRDIRIRELR